MFLLNPLEDDALIIDSLNNKPLEFRKVEHCYKHIRDNLEKLKAFAVSQYNLNTSIQSIYCFKKKDSI